MKDVCKNCTSLSLTWHIFDGSFTEKETRKKVDSNSGVLYIETVLVNLLGSRNLPFDDSICWA